MKEVTLQSLRKKNRARLTAKLRGKVDTGGWDTLFGLATTTTQDELFKVLTDKEYERLYCNNAVIFSCVRKVTSAVVDAKVLIELKRNDGFEVREDHPLAKLFELPNPDMDWTQFLSRLVQSLLLTGVGYVFEERNRGDDLTALWPLPTSWVTKQFDRGRLVGYRIRLGVTGQRPVRPEDLIAVGFPDPRHPGHFCGPLQAASRDQQIDEERGNYLFEMLTNLTFPGVVLYQDEPWTPEQKLEARGVLQDRVGRGNRGSPLFVEGQNARLDVPAPLKDLDWPGVTTLAETRICTTFGVPPIVIGLKSGLERSTYSNFVQAERAFYRGTMPPLWRMIESSFTRDLLRKEGDEDHRVRFDFSAVPQLQEDANERAARSEKLLKAGAITRNEAREMVGMEALPDKVGDVLLIAANIIEEPADGSGRLDELAQEEDDTETAAAAAAEEELEEDEEMDKAGKTHDNGTQRRSKWAQQLRA